MKKYMLLAMVMMMVVCGSAWAATSASGAPGTNATNDIELKIDKYCSVAVGKAQLQVTNPITGTANANATCVVAANFNAKITPTIDTATGYTLTEKPNWVWTPTIGGDAEKYILAGQTSETDVNVALAGVALSDVNIASYTKVATLTVTISEGTDEG